MPVMPGPSLSFGLAPNPHSQVRLILGQSSAMDHVTEASGNDNLAPKKSSIYKTQTLWFFTSDTTWEFGKNCMFKKMDCFEKLSSISGSLMGNHECIWWSEGRWCCWVMKSTQTGRSRQCFVTKSNIRLEPTSSLERPLFTGRVGKVAKQYHQKFAWNESWFLKQNLSWKTPG